MRYEQINLDIGLSDNYMEVEKAKDLQRQADLQTKIKESTNAIQLASDMSFFYYKKPLIVTYSGGKDSDVVLHLVESCLASDKYEVLNSHTSVDAPETVYHIRNTFKRLNEKGVKTTVFQPRDKDGTPLTMWNLIVKSGIPPSRQSRYCCRFLKETSTPNAICLTGVREAEGIKRQGRDIFNVKETTRRTLHFSLDHADEVFKESKEINDDAWDCSLIRNMKANNDVVVTPIYYWSEKDVWDYITLKEIQTNPLYEMGYSRVGCIGCPLSSHSIIMRQFNQYPTYKRAYIKAFEKMLEKTMVRMTLPAKKDFIVGRPEKMFLIGGWKVIRGNVKDR